MILNNIMHERTNSDTYLCSSVVFENLICRTFAILCDKRAFVYRKIGKLIIKSLDVVYIDETRRWTTLTEEQIALYSIIAAATTAAISI